MLLASVIMFVLTINSGDPLRDLRESTAANRDHLMAQRTASMGLNNPWYVRYWDWLRVTRGDSGTDIVEHDGVRTDSDCEVHVAGKAKFQT